MTRVAFNGFGRTGRLIFKALLERYGGDLEVVAINDMTERAALAHLLRYDSTYGPFEGEIHVSGEQFRVVYSDEDNEQREMWIAMLAERDPAALPWRELAVDIVIEATDHLSQTKQVRTHLRAGAKKVIIARAAPHEDLVICLGVNQGRYDHAIHHVVANASGTTNCLAVVAKTLHERFGIRRGMITVVHSYTADQPLQDTEHIDLRRARAAALNSVPTTTDAVDAMRQVLPELATSIAGYAIHVPTPTVSLLDFTVQLERSTDVEQINQVFQQAAESADLEGILGTSDQELVSSDFIGTTYSAVVDLPLTTGLGNDLFKVVAWYDNEWSYAMRAADLAALVADAFEG